MKAITRTLTVTACEVTIFDKATKTCYDTQVNVYENSTQMGCEKEIKANYKLADGERICDVRVIDSHKVVAKMSLETFIKYADLKSE